LVVFVAVSLCPLVALAEEKLPAPETYVPHPSELSGIKKATDDPRDLTVTYPLKDVVPPEIMAKLTFDQEKMKKESVKLLGFTAPELVGKIAPEIKPGKYTYKDVEQNPGLKDLFPPEFVQHIKAPGPPFVCAIPEFEIIPTIQHHLCLPYIELTQRNLGKTKLDKDGYIVPGSWEGGIPFPLPSGNFKAQQLYYSFEKRSDSFNKNSIMSLESNGYNKNLKMDKYTTAIVSLSRLMGRFLFPPYGWFDKRAERNGEFYAFAYTNLEPRALRGLGVLNYHYDDPNKLDALMIYVPSLRRIRKMSATDTQDPQGDLSYDDSDMMAQKITPKKFPYKFDIIAEREYLLPTTYNHSPMWVDSKNHYALREVEFQRRPCYVLELTQLDPNYIYSKRVFYIDKETFICLIAAYYDQKGRLYRTQFYEGYIFFPEFGQGMMYGGVISQHDYIDLHSTFQVFFNLPAVFTRKNFTIQYLIKMGK
jgi:hypothetical protein